MRTAIILCALTLIVTAPVYASTLDGYDRAKLADENYALANGDSAMKEAVNDPELAAVMKKYLYADIVRQAKISTTERKLVEIVVLTTNQMRDSTPDFQKHLQDNLSAFCFGDTYTRGTLDYKMREMLTMAVIGTLGTGEPQYKSHVAGTLAAGATKEEVIGIITVMNPYIGFPRTLNALRIANEVFSERK
ncbi:MAG: carboxymuconolactone decarboxylase family protein [Synergistaceae bacterium]|nr:carboxymuconolactone decarboxylase family protein [Synergistaceae bacterium]MBQ7169106.1 carboxymuconolactone decarboxylase family protein [Synergistaceae bacterium]